MFDGQTNLFKLLRGNLRLITSYLKANWKLFLIGLSLGIILIYFLPQLPKKQPIKKNSIGVVGNFTISSLPLEIQQEMSFGLTRLTETHVATSGAATSWVATDSGKTVIFKLDPNLFWQDGTKFDTTGINYSLKGVEVKRLSLSEVAFKFKSPFAPLPAIVSRPLFKEGLIGLGDYKLKNLKFAGKFLDEVTLESQKTGDTKTYKFYPSDDMAATALKLGSVTKVQGLHKTYGLESDSHYEVRAATSSSTLAALFLNHRKKPLDEKSFRQALAYGLPDSFGEGDLAYSSIAKNSWAEGEDIKKYPQDVGLAEESFGKDATGSAAKKKALIITTTQDLKPIADKIAQAWTTEGQPSKVQVSDAVPQAFDVFLSYMTIPPDPDQYALWHSTQRGNISGYNSPKVDKLLEEGRQTTDPTERKRIYNEFQKALSEDLPAIFLFYPKVYTIDRK